MKNKFWVTSIVLTLGVMKVEACGPDFQVMLTNCRESCLQQVKSPGFAVDVRRIAETPGPTAVEDTADDEDEVSTLVDRKERPRFAEKLRQMRQAATADEAYRLGEGLPEAKRLYTAGAVAFRAAHDFVQWGYEEGTAEAPLSAADVDLGLTTAIGWFERVVALPPDPHEPRFVLATYMLARSHFLRDHEGDQDIAVAEYRETLKLVANGAPDPVGLANATLGELGRIALTRGQTSEAIALYIQQATGPGAGHGMESLWMILGIVANDDTKLKREIRVPLSQKALIAFALSNLDDICVDMEHEECGDDSFVSHPVKREAARRIAAAVAELDPKGIEWTDEAAAVTFASGDFETTAKLLKHSDTPYAQWIRAKLALHAGDMETATKEFSSASRAFAKAQPLERPKEPILFRDFSDQTITSRVLAESGVLSLSRSDYTEALYQLTLSAHFPQDARYIAEQVLTLDELKGLVDKEDWAAPYKDLLARRLMRAKRVDEAAKYYTNKIAIKVAPRYIEAWHEAATEKDDRKRAQAWYKVAELEVLSGMELSGTEGCPDENEFQGDYDCIAPSIVDGPLVSDDERHRVKHSRSSPYVRFHYRTVGVEHLFKAADLLPRKSEVLTAVLCNGVHWLHHSGWDYNQKLIQTLYHRYLKDGQPEAWAENFGSKCPEPQFGT